MIKRAIQTDAGGGEGVEARVVMEMIINPSASEKMAKGGA